MRSIKNYLGYTLLITTLLVLAGCSTTNKEDPLEPYNRGMYGFNRLIDKAIIKPVAIVYDAVTPDPLQKGVSNFFQNIDNIPTVANDLLQFRLGQALRDTSRFAINSTVGVFGLFDVAERWGIEHESNDVGLTLAYWGYENSSPFVIPLLGMSTIRDAIGTPANYYLTPYPYINDDGLKYGLLAGRIISKRADVLDFEKTIDETTLDRYIFERDAFLQNREAKMRRNKGEAMEAEDPFVEEL